MASSQAPRTRLFPGPARPSLWVFSASCLLSLAAYLANVIWGQVHPGNLWGLSYGVAASALLLGVSLLGLRRRIMSLASRWRLGSARAWLTFHLYGGTLFLLLVLMHSGFALPTGALTWGLWLLSLWTVLSGFVGLVLQRWIPKVLASGLAIEVLYDRIPELIDEVRSKAEALVAGCEEPVRALYARNIAPAMATPHHRLIYYLDITGGIQSRMRELDYLRSFLPADDRDKLGELRRLYRTKLEIDAHYTLQRALRLWLYAHVPVSIVLVVMVVLHVLAVLYY